VPQQHVAGMLCFFIMFNFQINIVKDTENWLLVLKNCARWGFLALGANGKTILGPREEKSWTTLTQMNTEDSLTQYTTI
jgi:hypothetical protein